MSDEIAAMKRRAAQRALEFVEPGMIVGLGSGSTAAAAIAALGETHGDAIRGVPTSEAARERAVEAGIPVTDLASAPAVDLAIDGADQVAEGVLLKGGGGAHTNERLVAAAADTVVIVVDERKLADVLDASVPLEVLPAARSLVTTAIDDLGATPTIRPADATDGPAWTERGNLLVDADFGRIDDPTGLAERLKTLPGVVDHGIFVDLADHLVVGTKNGVRTSAVR